MTRILLLWTVCALLFTTKVTAQANVFNPNDPIVAYDSLHPPATPPANVISKWVRSKKMDWNTDKFKCYYYNGMAFRLRFPNGYNPANTTKKYPLILFLHGGGEIGPVTDNDNQLMHTGVIFQGMIDQGQYDAFLLYPQMSEQDIWQDYHFTKINNILDSLQKYCFLDVDRVMTQGLSAGAFGSLRFSAWYPQRSTLATSASPALIQTLQDYERDKLLPIPMWIGNGGLDNNPDPASVQGFADYITSHGGRLTRNYYPDLGHPTWAPMYTPPLTLPFWLTSHKANPMVYFGANQYDLNTAISSKLGLTAGFYAYEWQRDGSTIATSTNGANTIVDPLPIKSFTGNDITVTSYGTYRARFKRTAASDWSEWSQNPAQIYKGLKFKYYEGPWTTLPDFNTLTPVTSGSSPNVDITSRPPDTYDHFAMKWEGSIYIPTPGAYTFETYSDDGSKLYFNNSSYSFSTTATVDNDGGHEAISKTGTVNVPTAGWYPIIITYLEIAGGETMQLFWSGPNFSRQQIPNSAFTPTVLLSDNVAPTAPSNLKSDYTGRTLVDLSWTGSTDNVGVTRYDVYVNGTLNQSTTNTKLTLSSLTAGTAYSITVKAADAAGNASPVSNTLAVTPAASGLRYKYYETGSSWSVLPNFSTLTPAKTGTSANFDLTPRLKDDNFGFVWEGYLHITTPGTYTFETQSDDGSKFYFNTFYNFSTTATVDNDGQHGPIVKTATVNIPAAGWYPVTATFFDATLDQSIAVYWTGPGIARQLIPDAAFVENTNVDVTAPTTPSNVKADYTGRTFVDLSWTPSTDNVGVLRYDIYVNGVFNQNNGNFTKATVSGLTPGSTYSIMVFAIDAANNPSSASTPISVVAAANGLRYKYYETPASWSVLPNFSTLTPAKSGASANFDLTPRLKDDNFGFVWEGYLHITTPGTYTFETQSDDGSKFYFNSLYSSSVTATVDNDGQHGAIVKTATVNIPAAGWYPIAATFFDATLDQSIAVYWTGPGIARQLIPDAAFVENTSADATPPTAPASLKSDYTGRTFVDLSWTASSDNVGVTRYDVYVNGTLNQSTTNTKLTLSSLTAGTAYSITVKAADAAGNASPVSNMLAVTPAASGLRYKYYETGSSWSVLPNFSTLTPAKTGTSANFDLTPRLKDDNFGFVWEGYLHITTPGTYTFETQSDDGSKFYFNTFYNFTTTATVDNDGQHGAIVKTATVNIPTAGWYPVTATFFDATLDQSIAVYWTGPGIARQLIPDAAFVEFVGSDGTPPTAPTQLKSDFTTRTFADVSWTAATDNVGVTRYDVYVNGSLNQSTGTATKATISGLTPGTPYTFTVKAVDAANNVSTFSNSLAITPAAGGLRYKYYETGSSWTVLPNFSTLTPAKTGASANFDLSPRLKDDNFGFVWEGYIRIPTAGTYTFETQSDDGSKFYFNSLYSSSVTATVDNDGQHGAIVKTATVNIPAAGWYPIAATFFDATLDQSIAVYWTGPGIARQQIPSSAFTEAAAANADAGTLSTQTFRTGIASMSEAEKEKFQQISAYPNPFNNQLQIAFYNTAKDNNISVDIYDLSGRMVYNKNFGRLSAGATNLRVDLTGQLHLDGGTYIARLHANGIVLKTWKLVKVTK